MPNLREWLEEFIELYHSEPCLWKVKTKEYHDRGKKEAAYEKLLAKLREIEPSSNKESVIKKNNNLRCAYKKEHKKVTDSIKSGSGTDDIYEPKLWYYSLLRFLDSQNTPLQSRSNLDDEINSPESVSSAGDNSSVQESAGQEVQSDEGSNASDQHNHDATPTAEATSSLSLSSSRKRNSEAALTKDVLISVRDHFKRPAPSPPPPMRPDDRFDIFGKAVAFKLRDLNKTQRILAEKIINETLAAAELGSLTTSHSVIAPISNSPFQQYLSNQSSSSTSSRSIHNTLPYSNQQSPIIQSPTSNRSIHNTSSYSNQPSAVISQSPMYEQPLMRDHSQTSSVVLLSIPESPEISDNATFIDNDVPNQPSATIQSQVYQQHINSAADYVSNYDASSY